MKIHPTAIIHPGAIIGKDTIIGPYCVVGPMAKIGNRTKIGAHTALAGPPEHKDHWDRWGFGVTIGDDCFISNAVTIDAGTEQNTLIGNRVTILRHAHVGHDAIIEDDVTLSCNVLIGGHSRVMRGANLGLGSIIHQNTVIGFLAMLGMGCIVNKRTNIHPCGVYVGNPAKPLKRNDIGIERSGLTDEFLQEELVRYSAFIEALSLKEKAKVDSEAAAKL